MQSLVFDFKKSPTFFQRWNKEFDVEDLDGNGVINATFKIVIVNDVCEDNIEDCINNSGQLIFTSPNALSETCSLKYSREGLEREYISLNGDVTFEFEDTNFSLRGAFLTTNSGYVLGYSINQQSLNVTNEMIFEDTLIFFDILEGVIDG